jgi:hypothetical protein
VDLAANFQWFKLIFGLFGEFSAQASRMGGDLEMSMYQQVMETASAPLYKKDYLESLGLVERLHRLLLDVIKDEFERLGILEINAVQALHLFNVGDHEVTAGELKSRGYYQGSNVSYNLKKLVEMASCTTNGARLIAARFGSA